MTKDLFKSIKDQFYERATSPLLGSFVLSWLVWNYKFVLLIFSRVGVLEKYDIIDEELFETLWQIWGQGLVYPLVTACVYIFGYPYPARFVFKFSRKKQKEIQEIKRSIENEVLLTVEESRAMRRTMDEREAKIQDSLDRKDTEIVDLKENVKRLEHQERDKVENARDNENFLLSKSQVLLLKLLAKSKGGLSEDRLFNIYPKKPISLQRDLSDLVNRSYLKRWYNDEYKVEFYGADDKGLEYLLDNKLVEQ